MKKNLQLFQAKTLLYFKKYAILSLLVCFGTLAIGQKHTISGYIKDASNGEALIGANVFIKEIQNGTVTNTYGFYSITLDKGDYNVTFSYLGYDDMEKPLSLQDNIKMDIELGTRLNGRGRCD